MADDESKEPKKDGPPMLPLILALLIIPLATMVIAQFVVIPQLQEAMGVEVHSKEDSGEPVSHSKEEGSERQAKLGGQDDSYALNGLVSNLAGTMGTRFVKVSIEVRGKGENVSEVLKLNKSVVLDAIITILSSQSIQSLEVPGGRNRLRLSLVEGINQALNDDLINQLYFTEFMIQ